MSALITAVTSYVTAAIGWMGQYATAITSNDLLVLGVVAVPLVGVGASLIGKMLHKRV